jgi:hypothetical protein
MKNTFLSLTFLALFAMLSTASVDAEKVGGHDGCGSDWKITNCAQLFGGAPCTQTWQEVTTQNGNPLLDEPYDVETSCTDNGCLNVPSAEVRDAFGSCGGGEL